MATVVPSIKGKLGNTTFYQGTMKAGELIAHVRPANELDTWSGLTIEERMQRDPAYKRILDQIAPYLANNADRFFGAIIVLVYRGKVLFEAVMDLNAKIPNAYKASSTRLGFLTIEGGTLVVLDGQHRLLGIEANIKGELKTERKTEKFTGGRCTPEIPNDDVSVIFIEHEDDQKTRRIFNRVNRYAKPTSRGDNIITSEDDAAAIVSRRLLDDGKPLGHRDDKGDVIVNWRSNTLADRSTKLTTISSVYETVKLILGYAGFPKVDLQNRPNDALLEKYETAVANFWDTLISGVKAYQDAINDPKRIPDLRESSQDTSLLFKPAAQVALVHGLILAAEDLAAQNSKLPLKKLVARVNDIDWSMTSPTWTNVLVRANGNIDTRKDALELSARIIAYLLIGKEMSKEKRDALHRDYNEANGHDFDDKKARKPLPDPVPDAKRTIVRPA